MPEICPIKTRLDTYFEKSEIGNYGTRKLRKLCLCEYIVSCYIIYKNQRNGEKRAYS